jgi:uncharacterized protein YegJ (DUF2314 family)
MASSDSSPVFHFPGGDEDMEQAAARARRTFRYFWREMAWEQRRIIPGLDLASVKATFSDPPELRSRASDEPEVEHMWLIDVDFDGRRLEGTLINSPNSLQSVQEGDRVKIIGKQLFDWMYVIDGNVYGGFTVDVLRSRMSRTDRKAHDNAWGYDFGTPGIVNLVPPEFLGEASSAKNAGKPRLAASNAVPQDEAEVASAEHPMSVNMRGSLDQALTNSPEMLDQPDHRGYTFLHNLALAGSWDGVDVCLRHGADPNQPAPNGMTPYALAKSLGWKRVMERLQKAGGG